MYVVATWVHMPVFLYVLSLRAPIIQKIILVDEEDRRESGSRRERIIYSSKMRRCIRSIGNMRGSYIGQYSSRGNVCI
jgi:hypothetical protein